MLLRSNIPLKYIAGKIRSGLIAVSIYSVVIAIVYHNFHITRITIPVAVPMVLGTVISLLLGFRSNQAYDRWWEARIIWGAIVNDSRTLARQISSFIVNEYQDEEVDIFKDRFVKRQMAWCYGLSRSLRNEDPFPSIERLLDNEEIAYLRNYKNIPSGILKLQEMDLIHAMRMGWINEYQQVELDRTLTRLCDSMGKCERIKNTIFPSTYSLYIHFALNLFIILLPFGLIEFFGLMVIPLVIAISASFMLIEKMAIHLQDPFENKPTDTPMTTISKNIENDLNQILGAYKRATTLDLNGRSNKKEEYYVL